MPFRHSPHRFFEDSRLSGSLRKCAKVFQRKNIPKKEIIPQKGLSSKYILTKPITKEPSLVEYGYGWRWGAHCRGQNFKGPQEPRIVVTKKIKML